MNSFRWIKYALLAAAVAAMVAAADLYLDAPMHFQYGEWRASPSAAAALALLALALLALHLVMRIVFFVLFLPSHLGEWRRRRAERERGELSADGLRALALGDHKQALKYFSRLADKEDGGGACAWLALLSAEKIDSPKKRGALLERAAASGGDIAAAAKAMRASEDGRLSEAFDVLAAAGAPDGSPLLAKMYLDIARRSEKWSQALAAAYALREQTPTSKWKKAVADIAALGLKNIGDGEELIRFWKNSVRADEQKQPPLLAEYICALQKAGDKKSAMEALERAAKFAGQSAEILSLVAAMGSDKMCEAALASAQKNETDADFLAATAMLAERLRLWGRARRCYQMANALRPDPRNAKALADLEQKMESDSAAVAAE